MKTIFRGLIAAATCLVSVSAVGQAPGTSYKIYNNGYHEIISVPAAAKTGADAHICVDGVPPGGPDPGAYLFVTTLGNADNRLHIRLQNGECRNFERVTAIDTMLDHGQTGAGQTGDSYSLRIDWSGGGQAVETLAASVRWGAIAVAPNDDWGQPKVYDGVVTGQSSKDEAIAAALARCKENGGTGCYQVATWQAGCGYVAAGYHGSRASYGVGATQTDAFGKCGFQHGQTFDCGEIAGGCN